MACRICGEGGGPICYHCTVQLGAYGGAVQTALLGAENARRRAEQQLAAERIRVADGIAREHELIAALTASREEHVELAAELRGLRGQIRAMGRQEAPVPSPPVPTVTRSPVAPAGAVAEPITTADLAPVAPGDPASERYSLLELD